MAKKKLSLFDLEDKSDIRSDDPKINKKYKNSRSKKFIRPTSDVRLNSPEYITTTIEEKSKEEILHRDPTYNKSTIWVEPSKSIDDKFVDILNDKANIKVPTDTPTICIKQFEPEKVDELPIHILMNGKTYKIKEIEVDDWIRSIKEVIKKYQKLNMLVIYLATSTFNSKAIDIEYYIKTNKLEDLLVEV